MPFVIGLGFAKVQILQKKKSETGSISWLIWNIFRKFCQHVDNDNI